MGLRDFVKQQKDKQQTKLAADAAESLHVEKHPLGGAGADFIDLYVKSILIFRSELPLEYPDPEEGKKQLRLFARSFGLTREQQSELEHEVSFYDDQAKTETLLELSSRDNAEAMTCFMCDAARLHGMCYKFEGDFADFWRDAACGIAKLSGERLAAAEKFCRDIASGRKLADPKSYVPVPEVLVAYFGQEAFRPADGIPEAEKAADGAPAGTGKTTVMVNKFNPPGTVASGTVTFASGSTADWYVDQTGRPGIDNLKGNPPTREEAQAFMMELQKVLG